MERSDASIQRYWRRRVINVDCSIDGRQYCATVAGLAEVRHCGTTQKSSNSQKQCSKKKKKIPSPFHRDIILSSSLSPPLSSILYPPPACCHLLRLLPKHHVISTEVGWEWARHGWCCSKLTAADGTRHMSCSLVTSSHHSNLRR